MHDLWQLDPMLLVSWAVWVIVSICLHELGHGAVAVRLGDRTPVETGHMTLNPLVHMGSMSLLMFALVGIAWGAMPVNERRLRGKYGPVLVALGGPFVNLVLFLGCAVLAAVWSALVLGFWTGSPVAGEPLAKNLRTFLMTGAMVNALLLALNLLPIPPLDGGRVMAGLSRTYRRVFFESERGMMVGFGLVLFVFFFGGPYLFGAAIVTAKAVSDAVLYLITGGQGP